MHRSRSVLAAVVALAVVACSVDVLRGQRGAQSARPAAPDNKALSDLARQYAVSVAEVDTPEYFAAFYEGLNLAARNALPVARARRPRTGGPRSLPDDFPPTPQLPTLPPSERFSPTLFKDPRIRASVKLMNQQSITIWRDTPTQPMELMAVAGLTGGETCSGTLIAADAVLTAAHCGCKGSPTQIVFGSDLDSNTRFAVRSFSRMVTGCTEADWLNGDVAVAFLDGRTTIDPMPIADLAWLQNPGKLLIAGFGKRQGGGSGEKRKAEVPIITPNCDNPDPPVYGCSRGRETVAGGRSEPDTCGGDSGGPAILTRPDSKMYIAATTSRAVRNATRPCGDGGIYVRLDGEALKWIRTQVPGVKVGS